MYKLKMQTPNLTAQNIDKIAALFAVRVDGKECGDLNSVVFQRVAGAEKFLLFPILMIIGRVGTGVKIMVADLQTCGAYRRPVDRGLRRFFPGGEGIAYTSV